MHTDESQMVDARRLIVFRTRGGLAVNVLYDELECINARLETTVEHNFWSFMGCGREKRVPVVRINAWTTRGGPVSTAIEVDDEDEGSELLESILSQIPPLLQEDEDDKEAAPEEAKETPEAAAEGDDEETEDSRE